MFFERNYTPPYVSNIADVQHRVLEPSKEYCLIMCSDGLTDLCYVEGEDWDVSHYGSKWLEWLDRAPNDCNNALHILREALGGGDNEKVSKCITVESPTKWMDDVTILVQKFVL